MESFAAPPPLPGGMPNTEGPPDGKARAKRKLPQPINVNMRMTSKAEGQCAG